MSPVIINAHLFDFCALRTDGRDSGEGELKFQTLLITRPEPQLL
jgi:hypothetical protein